MIQGDKSSALPFLASGFGTDSSYPPMPGSSRITASQPNPSLASMNVRPPVSSQPMVVHPVVSEGLRPGQYLQQQQQQQYRTPSPQMQMPVPTHTPYQHTYASSSVDHVQQTHTYAQPRRYSAADPYQTRPPPPLPPASDRVHTAATQQHHPVRSSSPPPTGISAPLPDLASLELQRERNYDDRQRTNWAKQVLKYVERTSSDSTKISEPRLVRWTDEAINIILLNAARVPHPLPEALYLRGDLQASGAFPTYVGKNLKEAFNDFEYSARLGWTPSWFRIGRDYELLSDLVRAKDVYERGVQAGDVGCIYRLGMAFLLGQLNVSVNYPRAIAMLQDAAVKADLDTPQPAYIYGMLLAGEFSHIDIPMHLLRPSTTGQTVEGEARKRIERAAYLNFAPAQFKCGWLYEYAQLECRYDPLLSVQYYSLASQAGEVEASMALSKWFLCGSEGHFDKNEQLAFTFADRAARKGLASAEFALGYYYEVGVGTTVNVQLAREWYHKAASQGNTDAVDRLEALRAPQASGMSRTEHEGNINANLIRQHTQARLRSEKQGPNSTAASHGGAELGRKKTMKMVQDTAAGRKRPNYRFEGANAAVSAPPLPPPKTMATADTGSRRPSAPVTSTTRIASAPQASGRHGQGYSLSDAPAQPRPLPASTSYDSKKTYATFAEMGIAPKKAGKEDCIIC